jgi:hypothetical protein
MRDRTFWLAEVGKKVATHRLGHSTAVHVLKVNARDRGKATPGYYVVSDDDGIWTVMYGPLATRQAADRAVKREIG